MTYTFKLSRRLAIAFYGSTLLTSLAWLGACNSSDLTTASDAETPAYRTDFAGALRERDSTKPGNKGKGRRGERATLVGLVVSPDPGSVAIGARTRFEAKGLLSDGSTTSVRVRWSATAGTIDSTGLYTATGEAGTYRVLAHSDLDLADTVVVNVGSAQASVTSVTLSPATVSLAPGAVQQFTATAKLSDGTTGPADVTYTATGGSITSAGAYTAGPTDGSFRVIAKVNGAALADTSDVVITSPPPSSPPPPPPPPAETGTTYFLADAESGDMKSWSQPWGVISDGTNPVPSNSSARARGGSRSYKYEITSPSRNPHYAQTLSGGPQVSMGSPNGRYLSGYYSFWTYLDAGYSSEGWNMLLGWMTGVSGAPSPISHLELRVWNGQLQLSYVLKNCAVGLYACPNMSGYENKGGYYFMTPQSPAGVKPFPRGRWVHVAAYYRMAPTNGQVKVWQDGQLIMDLTAPTMNTFGGHSIEPLKNSAGDMMLQVGIYGGPKTDGTQRMYLDDFKVTDYRPQP